MIEATQQNGPTPYTKTTRHCCYFDFFLERGEAHSNTNKKNFFFHSMLQTLFAHRNTTANVIKTNQRLKIELHSDTFDSN